MQLFTFGIISIRIFDWFILNNNRSVGTDEKTHTIHIKLSYIWFRKYSWQIDTVHNAPCNNEAYA